MYFFVLPVTSPAQQLPVVSPSFLTLGHLTQRPPDILSNGWDTELTQTLIFCYCKENTTWNASKSFWAAFALLQKGLRLSWSWLLYSIIIWLEIYETLLWKPVRNLWHLLLDEDWTKLRKVASQCWYWYWFDYCAAARSNLGLGSVAPAPGNDLVLARNAGTKCWRAENTWYKTTN